VLTLLIHSSTKASARKRYGTTVRVNSATVQAAQRSVCFSGTWYPPSAAWGSDTLDMTARRTSAAIRQVRKRASRSSSLDRWYGFAALQTRKGIDSVY
jgi:hypothetical protein